MKLIETIETFISGDWGNESHTEDTPCEVFCVRGADIEPIKNQDYNHIHKRCISKRSNQNKLLQENKKKQNKKKSCNRLIVQTFAQHSV